MVSKNHKNDDNDDTEATTQCATKYMVVMRHSVRMDTRKPSVDWEGKSTRPYDPPICDFDLPLVQAKKIKHFGLDHIYTSPFKRCLQTAAIMATALNITKVTVHHGLGEVMAHVRHSLKRSNNIQKDNNNDSIRNNNNNNNNDDNNTMTFVSKKEAERIFADAKSAASSPHVIKIVSWCEQGPPDIKASYHKCLKRLKATIEEIRNTDTSPLIVSHMDCVKVSAEPTKVILSVLECGYVVLDQATGKPLDKNNAEWIKSNQLCCCCNVS